MSEERDEETTWPRSADEPVADIDRKRRGKVDPALSARAARGADPTEPAENHGQGLSEGGDPNP